MGYSGYEECLCKNGHYSTYDACCYDNEFCYVCKKEFVWRNQVDETNCEGFPFTQDRLSVKAPRQTELCNSCGHTEQIKEATYHVPTAEEMEQFYKDREKHFDGLYGED